MEYGTCDFCGYTTACHKAKMGMNSVGASEDRDILLCPLCFSTPAGNALSWPNQYAGQVAILKTMNFVGNTLLAAAFYFNEERAGPDKNPIIKVVEPEEPKEEGS